MFETLLVGSSILLEHRKPNGTHATVDLLNFRRENLIREMNGIRVTRWSSNTRVASCLVARTMR